MSLSFSVSIFVTVGYRVCLASSPTRLLSILLLPRHHLTSIDWSFVRADRPDDSAVAPLAPSSLSLQDETGGGGGGYPCDSGGRRGLGGAGSTARDSAGGIRGDASRAESHWQARTIAWLASRLQGRCVRMRCTCAFREVKKESGEERDG